MRFWTETYSAENSDTAAVGTPLPGDDTAPTVPDLFSGVQMNDENVVPLPAHHCEPFSTDTLSNGHLLDFEFNQNNVDNGDRSRADSEFENDNIDHDRS